MRPHLPRILERYRVRSGPLRTTNADGRQGAFVIPVNGQDLFVIAADAREPEAQGWQHVSVSTPKRCPTWEEMCAIKDLWWEPEETVIQFHPPRSVYVSNHPYVLHLWKPPYLLTLPPIETVGIPGIVGKMEEK